ncbi:imidazolonepropionase-like domain-containing protein [Streptomyces toxytricini]|uniref:Imidazolonepropionase-like domain-containing protein n=1 Tax=Streptomyces toxytricini TaxID=67369 RepID=A0ABW8EB01_STRT5
MLTLHRADILLTGRGADPLPGGAVLVDGGRITAVGPYEELGARAPQARVRRWPGLLAPGLVLHGARELLEEAYHPDGQFEADALGTEPITGAAELAALGLTEARRGNSARRAAQKLLARGAVAVSGRLTVPAVRTAVARSGLELLPPAAGEGAPGGRRAVSADPFEGLADVQDAFHGVVAAGGPARFAVFAAAAGSLREAGSAACVATVIGGRLLHRRR